MYQIIDGKRISQEIKDELREKAAALKAQGVERCLWAAIRHRGCM